MPWDKSFSIDTVLDRAGDVFLEHGYEATTMTMLLARMGIQKGSFYATFTSKRDVFVEVLKRYIANAGTVMADQTRGRPPLEALVDQMQTSATWCSGRVAALGCMLVNTAIELGPRDPEIQELVHRALEAQAQSFTELVEQAQASGALSADLDAASTAQMLVSVRLGLRVMGRAGMTPDVARSAVASTLEVLELA
ncbi:TetR/AcrR family transcriptional regulator [Mycobacterium spongiae]|uniref:TetR family transcriptional regulator n=1 Tax=Mycobacterium spongiae TaxID=886343 RepID=A0A975JUX6_9MYCO|nr:TetR/AcrR family transcriptional regulator [Mycobacterium spongiae]QUR65780.1 TetR family transcriptional regulator [Mycobacterium spongiae]